MNIITKKLKCIDCGKEFEWEIEERWQSFCSEPERCDECEKAHEEKMELERQELEAEQKKQELADNIEKARQGVIKQMPARFKATDTEHEGFNSSAWSKVEAWMPSDELPWLGLYGLSGLCKTRMAYLKAVELAGHHVETTGKRMSAYLVTGKELKDTVIKEARGIKSGGHRGLWDDEPPNISDKWTRADLLVIDDLGKGRLTPCAAEGLFAILDHRHSHGLTTIWTANSSPYEIGQMIDEKLRKDMAAALAGRLTECSKLYELKPR